MEFTKEELLAEANEFVHRWPTAQQIELHVNMLRFAAQLVEEREGLCNCVPQLALDSVNAELARLTAENAELKAQIIDLTREKNMAENFRELLP